MQQFITHNITAPNNELEILKNNFPNCFDKNGSFYFDKFKTLLQNKEIDFYKESYGLEWLGKSYARLLACDPSTTLLTENKTWNHKPQNINSQNILIKGDNLEVLKHLVNAYHQKIKMIYIDPPYNTGSDNFIYQDDRQYTIQQIKQLAGVEEDKAKKIHCFINSKSNSHSAWLTFMYPRLYIARQLLKNDGVIFISIDDNEVAQLKLLMDEIFGEENTEIIIWKKNDPKYDKNTNAKIINRTKRIHEYLVIAYQNKEITNFGKIKKLPNWKNKQSNPDNDPRGEWQSGIISFEEGHKNEDKNSTNYYTIILPSGRKMTRQFFVNKQEFDELLKENRIYFPKEGDGVPRIKIFENEKKEFAFETILEGVGSMNAAKKELANIFNINEKDIIFDTPKPTLLLLEIIRAVTNNNDTILDFFAGSGTTADATMQLNAEDLGNRNFILVQIPEPIDPNKNKTAYDFVKQLYEKETNHTPTIFDITKERIVRASQKIKTENIDNLKNQDLGFKIFETIPIWENYNLESTKFNTDQKLFDEKILTPQDIETLLITWKTFDNILLTQNLKPIDLDGYTSYYFANKLYLMHKGFQINNLRKIFTLIEEEKDFYPATIIAFGYNFESKNLREISENIVSYRNKKSIEMDFVIRY